MSLDFNYLNLTDEDLAVRQYDFNQTIAKRHGIENMPVSIFHRDRKKLEKRAVERRKARNRYLETCNKEITALCPCGSHRGIRFLDNHKQVAEENMCPRVWWLKLVVLALDEGTGTDFVTNTPLELYLEGYKL